MADNNLDQGLLELAAYMITSARGLLDEPATYGPFRLIDGASRLCGLLSENGHDDGEFFDKLQTRIDEGKFSVMGDLDEFRKMLDAAVIDITHHLMEKSDSDKT